jgi:23S rRNA (guanosine2251-2'-O)-methyltransferase
MNKAHSKLWIYGKHTVVSALRNKNRQHYKLLLTKAAESELKSALNELTNIKPQIVAPQQLEQILPKNSLHQGIALETSSIIINGIENLELSPDKINMCLVALDQITDQNNIGSIIRSAAAFNIDGIITLTDNTPAETGHIAKAASGGLETVPLIKVTNLAQTIKYLQDQGFWSIGLDGSAQENLDQIALPNKSLFIVGSEHNGLRRLTKEKCDMIAKIKMSSQMESLNVSVATAIAMQTYYRNFSNSNIGEI